MKRTIGFILVNTKFGGGERILWMLMNEFKLRGYEIEIYTYNPEWITSQNDFNNVILLKTPPIGFNKYTSYKELKCILAKNRPDYIICFSLALAEIAVWATKANNIPIICSERCDPAEIPEPGVRDIHRWLRLISFSLASGVVFQTEEVQKYFPKLIQKHSCVIPNPIIDNNLPPLAINRKKKIVSTGRLSKEKNFEMLIRAFSKITSSDYTLTIYGEGPQRDYLENIIGELNLSDKVSLPGSVDRVIDHISDADIFVMPSNHEGMPNSLIEGMSVGLVPISTDFASGGARSLITNGINGFLIPVGDESALTDKLDYLINNPDIKERIRKKVNQIRQTHSKEAIIPKWIEYIESLSKFKSNE